MRPLREAFRCPAPLSLLHHNAKFGGDVFTLAKVSRLPEFFYLSEELGTIERDITVRVAVTVRK